MNEPVTRQMAVLDLLSYIGVKGFSAAGAGDDPSDERDIDKAIFAINGTLNLIYSKGPQSIKNDERSSYFNAPTPVVLTMTQGAGGVFVSGKQDWMLGCSVLIEGDSVLNRIIDVSGNDCDLLRAYLGESGSRLATVYHDSIILDDDVRAVIEPVEFFPHMILHRAKSREDFDRIRYVGQHSGFYAPSSIARFIGTPELYMTERRLDSLNPSGGSIYLMISPMPGFANNLTYNVYLRPERVTRGDLALDGSEDPLIEFTLAPEVIEDMLLPIARWRFFSHPSLLNAEARSTVRAEYEEAYARLTAGTGLETEVADNHAEYI